MTSPRMFRRAFLASALALAAGGSSSRRRATRNDNPTLRK